MAALLAQPRGAGGSPARHPYPPCCPVRGFEVAAALLGVGGIIASSFIYLVPARPAWNSKHTVIDFHLTAWLLGPLFLAALGARVPEMLPLAAASAQLLNLVTRQVELATSDEFELRASARLFGNNLKNRLIARIALLITGGIVPSRASFRVTKKESHLPNRS